MMTYEEELKADVMSCFTLKCLLEVSQMLWKDSYTHTNRTWIKTYKQAYRNWDKDKLTGIQNLG